MEAREHQAVRERETRRKILVGAMVLDRLARGESAEELFKADMDRFLERDQERALEALILEAGGDKKSLGYLRMCIRALGSNLIYRAVSEAKLFCRETPGAHFPRVLTSRCEAIAHEVGVVINPRRRPKTTEHGRGLASGGPVAQRGRPRWGSVNERGGAQGFILRSRKGPGNARFTRDYRLARRPERAVLTVVPLRGASRRRVRV